MAAAGALCTALGRPGSDPAQLVLHIKLQRKLGTTWQHGGKCQFDPDFS